MMWRDIFKKFNPFLGIKITAPLRSIVVKCPKIPKQIKDIFLELWMPFPENYGQLPWKEHSLANISNYGKPIMAENLLQPK